MGTIKYDELDELEFIEFILTIWWMNDMKYGTDIYCKSLHSNLFFIYWFITISRIVFLMEVLT